jgi:hypothetical protein
MGIDGYSTSVGRFYHVLPLAFFLQARKHESRTWQRLQLYIGHGHGASGRHAITEFLPATNDNSSTCYPLVNKHSDGKWQFKVMFPIKHGDFP